MNMRWRLRYVCAGAAARALPWAVGLTAQHEHEQDTAGEKQTGTKKPKSRLQSYVKILAAPGGVDVQVLFDSIREDISFILRVQMKTHKRLFMRWSPKLNLDASLVGSQLERAQASLIRNSCEPVFRMITQALHDGALPAKHLCHALNASIVQCTRVDVGTDSGAAPGDILWHAMCTRCLQELRTYVHCRGLEKVDISPKPHLMYARMLQIKQFGDCEVYVYQEENPRHNAWPWKPGACAACYATSGVIRKYKLEPGGAQKAHGGAARKSRAQALGGPPRSFQRIFREQCSDYFASESETTHTPGGSGAGFGGSENEEDDRDYECEDLLSSDDDREVGAWQGHGRDFDGYPGDHDCDGEVEQGQGHLPTPQGDDHNAGAWQGHGRDFDGYPSDHDCDGEVEQGQGHALTLQGDDLDGHCSVLEFFAMDEDMQGNVQEFLLDMRAASPASQTGGAGATGAEPRTAVLPAAGPGTSASTDTGTGVEPQAAVLPTAGPCASASASTDTGTGVEPQAAVLPTAGPCASASASTDTGTGAEPPAAVLPTASPGASASASTNTGTHMEPQAAVPTPGRKRSAMDYVLNPGLVPSSASAGVAFALRMLQQSVQGNTHEAPAQ